MLLPVAVPAGAAAPTGPLHRAGAAAPTAVRAVHTGAPHRAGAAAPIGRVHQAGAAAALTGRVHQAVAAAAHTVRVLRAGAVYPLEGVVVLREQAGAALPLGQVDHDDNLSS